MSLTRRQFLLRAAGCGAAAAAGAHVGGCAPDIEPAPRIDVPPPVGDRLVLVVSAYPELARPGGAVTAHAPGLDPPVLLARTPEGGFAALSSVCTHLGCPLAVASFEVVCPCHASRFDLDGRVLHPPAKLDLPGYRTTYDATTDTLVVALTATA